MADDGDETEAVDGDGHRLDESGGDVVAGELDDVAAALLQRQDGVDVSVAVGGSEETVAALHVLQKHDQPVGDDERERPAPTAQFHALQVDSLGGAEEAGRFQWHHGRIALAQRLAHQAQHQRPVEQDVSRVCVDEALAVG